MHLRYAVHVFKAKMWRITGDSDVSTALPCTGKCMLHWNFSAMRLFPDLLKSSHYALPAIAALCRLS